MQEQVILVDKNDNQTGVMEKMEAHRRGALHRAISVFVFNGAGKMLLQKRARGKYHSGGLLTNACCSHPRPGESAEKAAERRLFEEMGLKTQLKRRGTFLYRAEFANGLIEHELDHVFEGVSNEVPRPDPAEADGFCYIDLPEIKKALRERPDEFTAWFRLAVERFY